MLTPDEADAAARHVLLRWQNPPGNMDVRELSSFARYFPQTGAFNRDEIVGDIVRKVLATKDGPHVAVTTWVDLLHALANHQADLLARTLALAEPALARYMSATKMKDSEPQPPRGASTRTGSFAANAANALGLSPAGHTLPADPTLSSRNSGSEPRSAARQETKAHSDSHNVATLAADVSVITAMATLADKVRFGLASRELLARVHTAAVHDLRQSYLYDPYTGTQHSVAPRKLLRKALVAAKKLQIDGAEVAELEEQVGWKAAAERADATTSDMVTAVR